MPNAISLRQLEYLVELSLSGSMRQAARQCGVSQPSLSTQISALESSIGSSLVERGSSGVVFTPVGRETVEIAVDILDRVRALPHIAERSALAGVWRLGVKATLGPYLLPAVVKKLHSTYPELRLFITEGAPTDLENGLAAGAHDLILAQLPIVNHDFERVRLFREPLFLAVATDDPLASRTDFIPEDLTGRDVLTLSPKFHLHDQVLRLCEQNRAVLRRDYQGTSLDALRQMVGMGLGVTLLPALYVESEVKRSNAEVVVLPQRKMTVYRSIGLAWRKSAPQTDAHRAIVETVRAVAKRRPYLISE